MKRLFAIILAVLIVFAVSGYASAKTVILDGDWVLEAHGDAIEIDSYVGSDVDLTLINTFGGLPVVAVGENAFLNNAYVEIIRADDTLTTIDDYGFDGCYNLREVVLTASLSHLGVAAFANTSALQLINLEDTSVDTIPAYCFAGSGLSTVALPNTCTSISDYAFQNCKALTSVLIPASVTEIAENAFVASDDLTIHAPYGSYAIDYAVAHEIPYEYTDLTEVSFLRGDADGDGTITIMDATKIQRVLVYLDTDNEGMIALRSTLTENGFGVMDATCIQRKLALYDDPYHIGESVTVYLYPDGTVFTPAEQDVEA